RKARRGADGGAQLLPRYPRELEGFGGPVERGQRQKSRPARARMADQPFGRLEGARVGPRDQPRQRLILRIQRQETVHSPAEAQRGDLLSGFARPRGRPPDRGDGRLENGLRILLGKTGMRSEQGVPSLSAPVL